MFTYCMCNVMDLFADRIDTVFNACRAELRKKHADAVAHSKHTSATAFDTLPPSILSVVRGLEAEAAKRAAKSKKREPAPAKPKAVAKPRVKKTQETEDVGTDRV